MLGPTLYLHYIADLPEIEEVATATFPDTATMARNTGRNKHLKLRLGPDRRTDEQMENQS